MNTIAVIQARMASTRLPNKVLLPMAGRPLLEWVITSARAIPGVNGVVVATSDDVSDTPIAEWCEQFGVTAYRGSLENVLDRMVLAAKSEKADVIIRLTADCPLIDPQVCGQVVLLRQRTGADYANNNQPRSWPDGLDCEVITAKALFEAAEESTLMTEKEHVSPFIRARQHRYKVETLPCPIPNAGSERWTVDYPKDLEFLEEIVKRLPDDNQSPSFVDVLSVLEENPELRQIIEETPRELGARRSLPADIESGRFYDRSFDVSDEMLARTEKVIPLGSQTFSKSYVNFPRGHSPMFLSHGLGGRVWDVDGNEYVDFVCGLLPIILGYCDEDVDTAIRRQLARGISFSLATDLEYQLAERLIEIVPCAEMVRFGKNGTDATSGSVRIARAATGRERLVICGYHGWQDWYVGATTMNKGVPKALQELTHPVPYHDLEALEETLKKFPNEFAAVMLEPESSDEPASDYLKGVKELAHKHGALFILDEIVSGFRFALGGAQEYYGVVPDLACYGKAMGNGMPIAALVGSTDLMEKMSEVFLSSTFGGEALSLAASIAVIDKMKQEPVIERIWQTGDRLISGIIEARSRHGLDDVVVVAGLAPWCRIGFRDHESARRQAIKTLFNCVMLESGVLIGGSQNICYAHEDRDVGIALAAYDRAFARIAEELPDGKLEKRLPVAPIEPIFSVRQ